MEIRFDEKEAARKLNCYKIELNAKPDLMAKTVNNENTLVLVLDMLNGFCNTGALASPRAKAVIAPIKNMLEKLPLAKKAFLRDCHGKDAAEFKWYPPHCFCEAYCFAAHWLSIFPQPYAPRLCRYKAGQL